MTNEQILIAVGVAVLVLAAIVVVALLVRRRRQGHQDRLRSQYGREYDETVAGKGRRAGVDDLDRREDERRQLDLRELDEATRADLRERMALLQFRFVDDPASTLLETQRVVVDALAARGYPVVADREQALRLLSVDHPDLTPPLRTLLGGSYRDDVGRMTDLFHAARVALRDVARVTYTVRDLPVATERTAASERPAPAAGRPAARPGEPGRAVEGERGDGNREPARPAAPPPSQPPVSHSAGAGGGVPPSRGPQPGVDPARERGR